MWIGCKTDDSHEMSSFIYLFFSEKKKKKKIRLLHYFVISASKVKPVPFD